MPAVAVLALEQGEWGIRRKPGDAATVEFIKGVGGLVAAAALVVGGICMVVFERGM